MIFESVSNLPAGYRYTIRRDTNLTKESSASIEAGLGKKFIFSNSIIDFKLDFFRHQVSDFINAHFEGLDSVTNKAIFYYYNLDKTATSTGAVFQHLLFQKTSI